ncbi:MAG: hypothetical protein COA94_06120 [Rickettsiales bacterium]|nr:MAG: hypothetical protein COA94_06120 [Rickettsiales bacterium]
MNYRRAINPLMDKKTPDEILLEARESLAPGYATDLLLAFVEYLPENRASHKELEPTDAGDLFRTLVLEENWSVKKARAVYDAAYEVVS